MHYFCVTSAGSRMQTYQSLCMYRQHHKSQIHIKTTHSHQRGVNTSQERRGPEPKEEGPVRPAQTQRLWVPQSCTPGSWLGTAAAAAGAEAEERWGWGLGWGHEGTAWALGQSQGGSGGDWAGPQGSVEDFQLSQVRLGCGSLEAATGARTADLSELTLHQAAIIGKQAPGKEKPKIIYQPSARFSPALLLCISKLTPRNWALILGSMR